MILLASNFNFLVEKGYDLLGSSLWDGKIAYVTTASKGVTDRMYIFEHKRIMRDMGLRFEEIDIEGKTLAELAAFFNDKSVIQVEGGNTFYLMKVINQIPDFGRLLDKLIDNGVAYVGTSAGAYIMGPSIETATWKDTNKDRYGLSDLTGLNIAPFMIFAHYKPEMKERIVEKKSLSKYSVRILKDGQGVFLNDRDYHFVGEGEEVQL